MHIMWDKQAGKCIIIVTIHIECFVQTNYMTAYRLEMKLYHALSCRNELVLDAYHAELASSPACVGSVWRVAAQGGRTPLHPRTESSGVVWGGPSPPAPARRVGCLEGLEMAQTVRCWL